MTDRLISELTEKSEADLTDEFSLSDGASKKATLQTIGETAKTDVPSEQTFIAESLDANLDNIPSDARRIFVQFTLSGAGATSYRLTFDNGSPSVISKFMALDSAVNLFSSGSICRVTAEATGAASMHGTVTMTRHSDFVWIVVSKAYNLTDNEFHACVNKVELSEAVTGVNLTDVGGVNVTGGVTMYAE